MTPFMFPNESAEYRRYRNELLEMQVRLRDEIERIHAVCGDGVPTKQ